MTCPACQGEVPAGARFCPNCASTVAVPSAEAAADPLRAALEASLGFQYRIERLLGRGGMGAVYLAHELALDRDVAIKVLPPDHMDTGDALERFRREARTAARLSHPNIVPLLTFGEVKGLVFFVMGYVRGESLAARIRRSGRLGVEESRRILGDVAEALAYAHAQGVVHRDIKPDNVLIDADSGRPMLTDFGVAKARSQGATLTATGLVVGTPHYMSPEQAAGRGDIDGRSDLYSLGVMGYAMLAGRLPFEGKTPGDVLVQHMTKEPPPIQATAPSVPATLAAAIMRCLAKDPSRRWPDARSLREALAPDEAATELPAKLRALAVCLQGVLAALLLGAYFRLYLASDPPSSRYLDRDVPDNLMFLFGAVGIYSAIEARRRLKLPWPVIVRSAVLQPSWWPGWYPRALRRPGDFWDRLPRPVRAARQMIGAMVVMGALLVTPHIIVFTAGSSYYERTGRTTPVTALTHRPPSGLFKLVFLIAPVLVGFTAIAGAILATLWLRTRLGDEFDFGEMALLSATWRKGSPWRRPAYQPLLRPVEADEAAMPRSEEELEKALERLAGAMPPGLQGLADPVRAAGRSLCVSIAALDREVEALSRDSDPQEAARLEEKLSALGPVAPAEPASRREMRELLAKQLSLIRGAASQMQDAQRERSRRLELLKSLWMRMSDLQAELSRHGAATGDAPDKVRALCAEIQRHVSSQTPTVGVPACEIDAPTLDR